MDPSARVKLLAALFGVLFVGSVGYLLFGGGEPDDGASPAPAAKGRAPTTPGGAPVLNADYPRCPECGKELPRSGECPYCLLKKQAKGPAAESGASLRGRVLAWSLISLTSVLGAAHLGRIWIQHRRANRREEEPHLKTRCPYCKRRVRFAARLENRCGVCPTCKQGIQFKATADA